MLLSIAALIENRYRTDDAFRDTQKSLSFCALYNAVSALAHSLHDAPPVIGLLARNSVDWVIADLAVCAAGKTLVPLPSFFSSEQISHITEEADIGLFLCDDVHQDRLKPLVKPLGRQIRLLTATVPEPSPDLAPKHGAQRIIYTSGTTGHPKGVVLGEAQLNYTMSALAEAISATAQDRYLSVLPFALLLEELCGVHVPLMVGGTCIIDCEAAEAVAAGQVSAIQEAVETMQPSVMVLVPELLRAWCASLLMNSEKAADSLRLVAVGGAKTPPDIIALAETLGIPAFEGYGLSECGSVVALNLPNAMRPGTVGRPLPGLDVKIIDGEITVAGPNIMAGYLGREAHEGRWATGDLGALDEAGYLIVHGRKDSVLVNGFGRNVSPEWVEAMLVSDFRVARAVLTHGDKGSFCALIIPTVLGTSFSDRDSYSDNLSLLRDLCEKAPDYAKPSDFICLTPAQAEAEGLFTASGRPRRHQIHEFIQRRNEEKSIEPDPIL